MESAIDRIRVLYIAGPSRSGSTLIGRILGEIPGFFDAGELIDLWDRGFLQGGLCSCGQPFGECGVWAGIMAEILPEYGPSDFAELVRMRDAAARSWRIPLYLALPAQRAQAMQRLQPYLSKLRRLYKSILDHTESRVVIDSSKNVGYAYLLSLIPGVELHCVHLVRDPRATAHSWRRNKAGLWQESPSKTALTWLSRNAAAAILSKSTISSYACFRYEDFAVAPRATLEALLSSISEEPCSLPFVTESEVELLPHHSVYGNPDRFAAGRFRIRLDDEWRQKISTWDYLLVTALTLPMLIKHQYRVMPGREGPLE